jgi:hypothetical protein
MKHKTLFNLLAALVLLVLTLASEPDLGHGPALASGVSVAPLGSAASVPLGAGFTYQGLLKHDDNPVTDTCDFQFGLYDAASLGTQLGIPRPSPA